MLRGQEIKIGLLGRNKVGKSFILNLLLFLTAAVPSLYESQGFRTDRLEAVDPQGSSCVPKELHSLEEVKIRRLDFTPLKRSVQREEIINGVEQIKSVLSGKPLTSSFSPFILPSTGGPTSCTSIPLHFRYGRTFHVKITYMSQSETQMLAYRHVLDRREPDSSASSGFFFRFFSVSLFFCLGFVLVCSFFSYVEVVFFVRFMFLVVSLELNLLRYNILCGHKTEEKKTSFPDSWEDIVLSNDVLKMCGQTVVVAGTGAHMESDRVGIREFVNQTMKGSMERYFIKTICLYVPCSLLSGGIEIIDIPGTDDCDPFNTVQVEETLTNMDLVVCVLPKALSAERTVSVSLENLMRTTLFAGAETCSVAFIHYLENQRIFFSFLFFGFFHLFSFCFLFFSSLSFFSFSFLFFCFISCFVFCVFVFVFCFLI